MHKIKHIHFVGIGGSGMSGIAEVLLHQGYHISGSDMSDNSAVTRLRELGATIFIGHHADHIKNIDVVVISSAIKPTNPEVVAARENHIPIIPRAQMLAELMRFRFGIAVAGTHGKTTTTSLVTSILAEANLDPTYVIGGRLNSSGSHAQLGASHYLVAEADESDASFLYLQPMISIVTNIDVDHMETYGGDIAQLHQTFVKFLERLPFYGLSVLCVDDPGVRQVLDQVTRPVITYAIDHPADIMASNLRYEGLKTYFTLHRKNKRDLELCVNLPGKHNVLNALAAISVALELDVDDSAIKNALEKFQGVGRRCQIVGDIQFKHGKVTMIDDYGHHPREIAATQQAIGAAYPDRRIVTVFQPHRYSRTHFLKNDFIDVLSQIETVFLLDVYAAGETPIEGADSYHLAEAVNHEHLIKQVNKRILFVPDYNQLSGILNDHLKENDVLLMQGAGNIGSLAYQILHQYKRD